MGYVAHHAILVTGHKLAPYREKAIRLGLEVTNIVQSRINGYETFVVIPDGSKEGWRESEDGDHRRSAWISYAVEKNLDGEDGYADWAEVRYGGDDQDFAEVTDHQGKHQRPEQEEGR